MDDDSALLNERSLTLELGLDTADLERRKRLVELTSADVRRIAELAPLIEGHVDRLVDAFFAYLQRTGAATGLMDTPLVHQARALKREHVLAMVSGEYGQRYLEQRVRLALLYSRAGIETSVFLAAFQDLLTNIARLVMQGGDGRLEHMVSLRKLAVVDIALIVDVIIFQRERVIRRQQEAIRELSTPVMQLREQMLLAPVIGAIDADRARLITEGLLNAIRDQRAKVAVLELTGVADVDTQVASYLLQTISAAELMGARVIVTGFSAEVAQALVGLGIDLKRLETYGDLRSGLEQAEKLLGFQLTKIAAPRAQPPRLTSSSSPSTASPAPSSPRRP